MARRAKQLPDQPVNDGTVPIESLTLDPGNACIHDERNLKAITTSVAELGAGRSILLDADGIVRAGNGTVQGATAAGIKRVRIIETDGTELIAVKRTDLTGAKAIAAALADNRASDLHSYDLDQLKHQVSELESLEIDLNGMGLSPDDIQGLIDASQEQDEDFEPGNAEGNGRLDERSKDPVCCPKCGHEFTP